MLIFVIFLVRICTKGFSMCPCDSHVTDRLIVGYYHNYVCNKNKIHILSILSYSLIVICYKSYIFIELAETFRI